MDVKALLDADMATIAGWLRDGFAWWIEELRGLLPARFARRSAVFSGWLDYVGPGEMVRQGSGPPQAVLIAPELCLVREVELPPLGQRDLERLVRLDADRIMPIPAERLVLAVRADPAERSRVTVAALPLDSARALLAEVEALDLQPGCIALASAAQLGAADVDFTSALAAAGLVAPPRSAAAGWWALVAFMFALNLGLLVWRDTQSVTRLRDLVDSQTPAVNAARAIANRISATDRQAQELAALRRKQDALMVLASATAALPPGAWVQRYAWDGATLRLSGYKRSGVDVVGALRKSPRFADVRAGNSGEVAEVLTGQPFDVTAVVRDLPAGGPGQ